MMEMIQYFNGQWNKASVEAVLLITACKQQLNFWMLANFHHLYHSFENAACTAYVFYQKNNAIAHNNYSFYNSYNQNLLL